MGNVKYLLQHSFAKEVQMAVQNGDPQLSSSATEAFVNILTQGQRSENSELANDKGSRTGKLKKV